ncbi:hypothetical protein Fmac_012294 [Flemingia macrophylla]|uniref:Uncharacterized protein n=1 Tax=Flemingia macrophylla TaxID=520843 RepID=A0ABD1MQR3_9FABA
MNPPQPQQPHRPSTSCPRHPDETFTGFCPSCLCERLALLDPNTTPSPRKPPPSSAAAAALKALFRPPPIPELRRTKSFSASKNETSSSFSALEPQRKSCDVRVRNNTLSNLFHQDLNPPQQNDNPPHQEDDKDEIRALEEPKPNANEIEQVQVEKEELFGVAEEEEEFKTMKDHMEQDCSHAKQQKNRDFKDLAGSLFSAASVFSKKLQKWRQKQKAKKRRSALPVEKPIGRQFRDTQSEIADYGFGRRSCDTDPRFSLDAGRFSLDAGRMSFDDPRYSIEEPRASWDGYLLGRTAAFPRMPTMLSVVEDSPVPAPPPNLVLRTDMQIPVEENLNDEDESVPGGVAQTREYYTDSGSRRRKSLDRSSSVRRSVSLEVDELSNGSGGVSNNVNVNAKVVAPPPPPPPPAAAGVDYVQGVRMMGFNDRDRGEFGSNSMREDCCSEKMFDVGVMGNGDGDGRKGGKKGRRWRWSIWGFIHRRGANKDEDEDRYSRVNGVERSYSESWGGDGRGGGGGFNGRVLRSNSSVSWRNAQGIGNGGGGFGGFRRNASVQGNGNGKKGKDEFVLERNRSARYSPNNIDNGLLRFYLTPMRGSRRNGSVKSRSNQAHTIARSVLGLY